MSFADRARRGPHIATATAWRRAWSCGSRPMSSKWPPAVCSGAARRWAVFVIDGGVRALRTVTIGQRNDIEAESREDSEAGTRVVAYPSDQMTDGARAEPRR